MNYCSECGGTVTIRVPPGDNRPRHVCDRCDTVHYLNPKVVAGCLVVADGAVLLCRRAIEPRKGLWTLPAGFLEIGETTAEGARRETREEANAEVDIDGLYTIFNLPHISQVYFFFRASFRDAQSTFSPGEETLETRLWQEGEIPWERLAFPVVANTLRHYFADRPCGRFPVRMEDIVVTRPPGGRRDVR